MKANELRIGNYIYADNVLAVVVEIRQNSIRAVYAGVADNGLCWYSFDHLSPILLTDALFDMVNQKFNREHPDRYLLKDNRTISFDCGFAFLSDLDGSCSTIWDKKAKQRNMYLHEWQNLYFALSGEEITLNVYSL